VEDTLSALTDAVSAGKIHTVGWSNTTAWQFARILERGRSGGLVVPTVFQPQYNLLDRNIEVELLPLLIDENVATTPWSPLGGGWLTGKYSKSERPSGATRLGEDPGRGVEAYDTRAVDRTWDVLEAVESVAESHGAWMGAVAIAWLLTRPSVGSVLLGARTADQLRQSLTAVDVDLSAEDLGRLTEVSAPGIPAYPYDMIRQFSELDIWDRLGTRMPR
jgi:aryl-alcohol dehydrogenase-like predicted oxidoreductase